MVNTETALASLAARQRGLITLAQAHTAGWDHMALQRQLRTGRLQRVQPRVYRWAAVPDDPLSAVLAAVLSAGDGAVAARRTAAGLHGLTRIGSDAAPEICLPQSHRDELLDVVVHRTRRLEPCDVVEVDGIPCTSPARTLIDLAAVVDRIMLTALVDDAFGLGLLNRTWLLRRAQELKNGRTGVGNLVALTVDGAEGKFRSWLERRAAFVLKQGGVPPPLWNEPIRDGQRLLGIADACWPAARLIVEFDGLRFHSTPAQRRADAARERDLVLAGWRVLRFTWQDVTEQPERVADSIRRALPEVC